MSHCLPNTSLSTLLRAGKIDHNDPAPEREHAMGRRWLITDILTETPCPRDAIPHLRRLFPEIQPEGWSRLLTDYDILTQEVLDLNHNTLLFYALSPTTGHGRNPPCRRCGCE